VPQVQSMQRTGGHRSVDIGTFPRPACAVAIFHEGAVTTLQCARVEVPQYALLLRVIDES
jgi:hypothetical protein